MKTISLFYLLFPFFISMFFFHLNFLWAQQLKGKVINGQNQPLIGANLWWINTSTGTSADKNGGFEISMENISDKRLVVSFVGFNTDTIKINSGNFISITLFETKMLEEVQVTGKKPDGYISTIAPIKTEVITGAEIAKGACCDLAGCFNTSASVQPSVTNIITNSQELRILGLSGVYNQLLVDGFPVINGLSYTYGISSYPGTLIDNIYVSKGANSVLQGYESISGQINVILKDPGTCDTVLVNAYMNSFSEKQFNLNYADKRARWHKLVSLHIALPGERIDRDKDNFLDLPLLNRFMLYTKTKAGNGDSLGISSEFGYRFVSESRIGGQKNYDLRLHEGSGSVYGQHISYDQAELFAKIRYRFSHDQSIALITSSSAHGQNSYFGNTKYSGIQNQFYSNAQYELKWMEQNDFKGGVCYRYSFLNERIGYAANLLNNTFSGNGKQLEFVPGAFAENIMRIRKETMCLITGVRYDRHNQFGGFFVPRALFRLDITEFFSTRLSAGKGWRTVKLLNENINLLASQRIIIIAEKLKPEEAWNYGMNLTYKLGEGEIEGTLGADFYRTEFQNQVFPDYDSYPGIALVNNFTGVSVSNGFQTEANLRFWEVAGIKLAYNYLDVFRMVNGEKFILPFNSKHKFLSTFSYNPLSGDRHIDVNFHWYGAQKLPSTELYPSEFRQSGWSKPYTIVNAQYTFAINEFEFYAGCENIFDFRQKQPIMSWQDPFSPYFDTSFIWGPTRGREFYWGIRYRL